MPSNFDKLARLLAELFQYDRADLDFGIYRIMNQKREEITRFLNNDLLPQVRSSLEAYQPASRAEIKAELEKTIAAAESAGFDPEASPKVKELRQQYGAAVDLSSLENEVFSDLYNFFRRYYADGDFISLRRYKEGVYAIPYEGEEVKLHWANADQYYIKSSENFRDYAFRLPDGRRVHFRLTEADTERDNVKAQAGKERRFVLAANEAIAEENGELTIRFEYRPDAEKQSALNEKVAATIHESAPGEPGSPSGKGEGQTWRDALATLAPTEKNPKRTLLEKHLADYTARNSFDYFIHKDLGGFLRRELDFFIKNEVMHLDDIESETAPRVEQYLSRVKVLRSIARKIIAFLEQLENFQKRLWLKKKFVVETGWCVTLDRVPQELYSEIAASDEQRAEWVRLFAIDEVTGDLTMPAYSEPLTTEFLTANPFLVLDTKFFSREFTERLLASFEDIDESCDGLLVHGENFQALNMMMERYRGEVKCVYIDPPYNTGGDGFAYKDRYQHSSWQAMLDSRLDLALAHLSSSGTVMLSIDDNEQPVLRLLMNGLLGSDNYVGTVVWKGATDNNPTRIAVEHEYLVCYAKSKDDSESQWSTSSNESKQLMLKAFERIQKVAKSVDELRSLFAEFTSSERENLGDLYRYRHVDEHGPYVARRNMENPGKQGHQYEVKHPVTGKPCDKPFWGWRFSESTMQRLLSEGKIIFGETEKKIPELKVYLHDVKFPLRSVLALDARKGSNDLERLFGSRDIFKNPKPVELLSHVLQFVMNPDSVVLDFFAGSGTTGHTVINLNHSDKGTRKYLLVEMGNYFDTVLKPRIQKVIYSADWKEGKPVSRQGSSHLFKYIRLESYEDTLNNLELRRTAAQTSLLDEHEHLREEYTLRYMLDVESSASLLSAERFANPFDYTLEVATGSAGETRATTVDLVETFNYLIGLRVRQREVIRGFHVVRGTSPAGERVLVIWRNTAKKSNADLDEFFRTQAYNTKDLEFDVIYVNGDNNLENLKQEGDMWKVRLVEEEFGGRMFEPK